MGRTHTAPGTKATFAAAPIHLAGLPRRGRLLLVLAVSGIALFFLLPSSGGGRRLNGPRPQQHGAAFAKTDILRYVDPLIGTVNGGHVFPGATLPYGMVKAVADCDSHAENAAGFVSDYSKIVGFSHLHDSGTGGNPSLGNFPLWVHAGCPEGDAQKCAFSSTTRSIPRVNGSARATPGYFAIELTNGVKAEMTTAERAALYRFSFPGASSLRDKKGSRVPLGPLLLLDLSDLSNSRRGGDVKVHADAGSSTARITGHGEFAPSFGTGSYGAFVCVDVRGARVRRSGTFKGDLDVSDEVKELKPAPPGPAGAWVQFEAPPSGQASLMARVGISFMTVEQACANAEAQIPDFDFDGIFAAAQQAWREKLGVVEIDTRGVNESYATTFWSGLYRSLISPQNYTGENPLWESKEPYFDSFYCIWDSFRAQHPLLTIVDPVAQVEMLRTLIDIYRNLGKLPDCRMSFSKGYSQGGSNSDILIADAYVKGLRDGIDWKTAYEAVVSDAEEEPKMWSFEGRGNLESYHKLGYIPVDDQDNLGSGPTSREMSRLVEYAYDDFCISLLAKGLGHKEDAEKYHKRSGNWKNIWSEQSLDIYRETHAGDIVLSPFKGFIQPRKLDGQFVYHNVRLCSPKTNFHGCYYDTRFASYEGSSWLYSFFVPQDMAALVEKMGGQKTFVDRLNYWHEEIAYMGNEPTFLTALQFHYAKRPDMSSYWIHRYIPSQFNTSVNGIPGNDDCAMGAFSSMVMMGFFPVAGQDVYLVTPPFFPEVSIQAASPAARAAGRRATIRIRNFDPTYGKKYVQSATLDGQKFTRSWVTHDFFREGGTLELTVTDDPAEATWGASDPDLPPSYPVGERDDIVDPAAAPALPVSGRDGPGDPDDPYRSKAGGRL
ncbi:hypothetical protein GGTG_00815 [Gaeumannomyces tritici R3-111a-1]|uniref:Glycosyl hydrolase n=1 Tax=Gaeumannomyces tritici (strain R3-111a-1) TaxID=644352 RepID=J3NHS8_GAET3|nr:hypothetical protein GGTG_00815 [Gaeumannomyces tritici R3-111a-1]EJT80821.1 hypothetical protein GGTG_00815 [Gaeumannomyces tritici R3-111a-1]